MYTALLLWRSRTLGRRPSLPPPRWRRNPAGDDFCGDFSTAHLNRQLLFRGPALLIVRYRLVRGPSGVP